MIQKEILQLPTKDETVIIPYGKCRNCADHKWKQMINWDLKRDEGYNICILKGSKLTSSYDPPPKWCPKGGGEKKNKKDYYGDFLFQARMMAFDAFDCLTSALCYIATDKDTPMIYREYALLALKNKEE